MLRRPAAAARHWRRCSSRGATHPRAVGAAPRLGSPQRAIVTAAARTLQAIMGLPSSASRSPSSGSRWDNIIAEQDKRYAKNAEHARKIKQMREVIYEQAEQHHQQLLNQFQGTQEEKEAQLAAHYEKEKAAEAAAVWRYELFRWVWGIVKTSLLLAIPAYYVYSCSFMRAMDHEIGDY
eukprot:TRINITY_DN16900_c1_g1_i1.p1 TRINITY_DN16900_c1_g1~~TRINITY_DN16900_c1_g1_i1.p1  ORF type:complete len:179 (+),score=50.80 TRINITY_DN16900_c1_g1_i1:77-613(+)